MRNFISIAIDGPAASGKSSVGLQLAKDLGFLFLDTGIMYRAVTLAALENAIDLYDVCAISILANKITIEIKPPSKDDGRVNDVTLEGQDVSWKIKGNKVNSHVSLVSTYQGVRDAMTRQQRLIAEKGNIVMVGRDIGTVVLPKADYKFFLNASIEERARRRFNEVSIHGGETNLGQIIGNLRSRDEIDSNREIAPLVPAEDAIIINTDQKNLNQVVLELKEHIHI